ncbi:hypothetical protein [Streptomyces brevispora]|uniref:Transposase n=1 Tax=Streptomyces brevispora TaxID=887462 RepID=A0ABZ1G979_9ACTN|nr:hypothetical protein [Streptomyces brevispora]WSC16056.1 hypothetical protein OIE64_26670 [Streptomyces brevispora]
MKARLEAGFRVKTVLATTPVFRDFQEADHTLGLGRNMQQAIDTGRVDRERGHRWFTGLSAGRPKILGVDDQGVPNRARQVRRRWRMPPDPGNRHRRRRADSMAGAAVVPLPVPVR